MAQELAAGVHAVVTEWAHEAVMRVEDVVMPDRGEEQALAAVVMVAVVGIEVLEGLAAVEELVAVEDADGLTWSSAESRTRRTLTRGGSGRPATPARGTRSPREIRIAPETCTGGTARQASG